MPRKTRKEKYAAKLNKVRSQQHKAVYISQPETTTQLAQPTQSSENRPKNVPKPINTRPEFAEQIRTYFFHDLKKSLIVISGILILEGTLYFAVSQGLLRFFNY